MEPNPGDCLMCVLPYDCTVRRPRALPCGHSLCTLCMERILQQDVLTCPTCLVKLTLPETGEFPVCHGMEAIVKKIAHLELTFASSQSVEETADSTQPPSASPMSQKDKGLCSEIQSMLQERQAKIQAVLNSCYDYEYLKTLENWSGSPEELKYRVQVLMDQAEIARKLVQREKSQVMKKKQQMKREEMQLQAMLKKIRAALASDGAYEGTDDADQSTEEERQTGEECVAMFPDVHTSTITTDVPTTSTTTDVHTTTTTTIKAKDLHCQTPHTLQAKDLRSLTQPVRDLLQKGLVFAVHKMGEMRSRYARISLEDGRLYLHNFQDQPLPGGAATVQVEELVSGSPPWRVFLQLAWPGRAPRRVVVRVSHNTPRGKQFLLLCTGQRGPCYAGTTLWHVLDKGQPAESVWGGDYECNSGKGGAALLPRLGKGKVVGSWRAGQVWGWREYNPAKGAQFTIVTKDKPGEWDASRVVFGQVVEGLQVVKEAVRHHPITQVTVVNCGAVLWQQQENTH